MNSISHSLAWLSFHAKADCTVYRLRFCLCGAGAEFFLSYVIIILGAHFWLQNQKTNFCSSVIFIYLLTHSLTPWSRVLLEKLTGSQLVKKYPAFYGTPRFITTFTSARHLSLS